MIRTERSRSGHPTLICGDRYIHSSYDPYREAERYVGSLELEGVLLCILVEPGLDYLSLALNRLQPHVTVLSIHCSADIEADVVSSSSAYFPGKGYPSVSSFLRQHVPDGLLASARVLEWEPSASCFGEAVRGLHEEVSSYFRRRNGSLTTTGVLGPRWIGQRIRSYLDMDRVAAPRTEPRPLIIAASGPSLERCIPYIGRRREAYTLWALGSAVSSLLARGIEPDLIIHTDAGYYARHHLRPYTRKVQHSKGGDNGVSTPLAAPLTASADHEVLRGLPRLPLLTESPMEEYLLIDSGIPFLRVPSHGTVSGTALLTALSMAGDALFFAGLDLAWYDLRAHAGGHSFEGLLLPETGRFRPLHGIAFERSPYAQERSGDRIHGWVQSPALRTYTEWFRKIDARRLSDGGARLFRLEPSGVEIPAFTDVCAGYLDRYAGHRATTGTGAGTFTNDGSPSSRLGVPQDAPPLRERMVRVESLISELRTRTAELNRCSGASEAAAYLEQQPLLSECAEESDLPAYLRLQRESYRQRHGLSIADSSISPTEELSTSLYSMIQKMETILAHYGREHAP